MVTGLIVAADPPTSLLPARWMMTVSLGSHIVLACFGVALPMMIWVVHRRAHRHDDAAALVLAKRWSKVAAVLFAVGAVSGTILSFEMGMLWPELMGTYGDVIGMPFALEGIAFFVEAIFLGIYLYGWDRLPPLQHRMMLVPIAAAGVVGTFCIIAVNGWMNAPSGFRLEGGEVVDADPLAAMFNHAVWLQFAHMWLAAVMLVGFTVAAVYAVGLLRGRDDRQHRIGFAVPFAFAAVAALFQPVTGHLAGMRVGNEQTSKLAAMELATETRREAPLVVGGVLADGEVRYGVEVPRLGSFFARGGVGGEVTGLDAFASDERPDDGLATMVHWSFQLMVAIGVGLLVLGAAYWIARRRGHEWLGSRRFLWLAAAAGPASILALELGWVTTEVGRQPWIAHRVMRIDEAVTTGSGVWLALAALVAVYASMGVVAILVLRSMARRWREGDAADLPTPYGPPPAVPGGEVAR
ncbi:MAG TPA: cytochrome ubiquinol oxidase subunit I [Acidimicrobiales bacterium]|nr:cytochrome ubiquinol oxidase subunit I [Acidimicrobiales bacterium]